MLILMKLTKCTMYHKKQIQLNFIKFHQFILKIRLCNCKPGLGYPKTCQVYFKTVCIWHKYHRISYIVPKACDSFVQVVGKDRWSL